MYYIYLQSFNRIYFVFYFDSPVKTTYLKNVKIRRLKKIYYCCKGWAPKDRECPIREYPFLGFFFLKLYYELNLV